MRKRPVARRKISKPRMAPKFINFERNLAKRVKMYKDYDKQVALTEYSISRIDVSTAAHYVNYEAPEIKRKLREKIENYVKSIEDLYKYHQCKDPSDDVIYRNFFNHFDINKLI